MVCRVKYELTIYQGLEIVWIYQQRKQCSIMIKL